MQETLKGVLAGVKGCRPINRRLNSCPGLDQHPEAVIHCYARKDYIINQILNASKYHIKEAPRRILDVRFTQAATTLLKTIQLSCFEYNFN